VLWKLKDGKAMGVDLL